MKATFDGTVYRWDARSDAEWYFTALPDDLSDLVRAIPRPMTRGFGALRVEARIGASRWRTSIFPGSDGVYSLPLKRAVRDAEGLIDGGAVAVEIDILDG